ncbi:ABC transporter permease [Companilactobacillus allii]|uniref:Nitrate ABC transporter permease n=1 Tax=Companilactobacillus allii TaxID=1847728 RepID=A0A1P8PZV0_9LACO|nr:ABC transporter permease [Companilactobacillus allii]APX71152.1 nitrate ABC transporter permease [Companilactobacillus allii]USQ68233.1 ABC transporter permease [Companilactobacillus allii]
MKRKQRNIGINVYAIFSIITIFCIWEFVTLFEWVPDFMLPTPLQVIQAFINDFSLLMFHARITLIEAAYGLILGMFLGIIVALIMDRFKRVKEALYPILVLTQTIPTIAIAPLLTVWFGFGIMPKVVLIIITIFFPVSIAMLNGFSSIDQDEVRLLRSMGASQIQIFWHIKIPSSLDDFFAVMKVAVTYSVIGAVISEWLGGVVGLGVYMTRVRKSYNFDKMFAVIFLISVLSLLLVGLINVIQRLSMPWKKD